MTDALRSLQPSFLDAELVALLGGLSIAMIVLGVIAVPFVLVRLPSDYFARAEAAEQNGPRSAWGFVLLCLRNLAGVFLLLLGVFLLALPGQGILTMVLGTMLLRFPGRSRLEQRLVGNPRVLGPLNALRRRAGRPPLEIPRRH